MILSRQLSSELKKYNQRKKKIGLSMINFLYTEKFASLLKYNFIEI